MKTKENGEGRENTIINKETNKIKSKARQIRRVVRFPFNNVSITVYNGSMVNTIN